MSEQQTNGAVDPQQATETPATRPQFAIQRIYVKDCSFEAPNTPQIFKAEWRPEVKLDLDTRSNKLEDSIYEVIIKLTVTTKVGEQVAFLCEVQQAGIFSVPEGEGIPKEQTEHLIGAFCPNILFPYAREAISSLVNRASFPQLNLSPVNFDALFAQYMQQRAEQAQGAPAAETADA